MIKPHGALHRIPQSRLRGHEGRPDNVAVGVIVWLASELMFFAALFAAYFTIRNVTNAPQTYLLDGKQHVLVAAGDMLYAFRLN